MKKIVMVIAMALAIDGASGAGFGLYEASSKTHALGGAVVGRAIDASANFWNPATLADLTNITVSAGFVTEHPRARMKVDGASSTGMDSGMFVLPALHIAMPLGYDISFGLGIMPEYGLGSKYTDGWELKCNSSETTVTSFTINPNLAWAITEDWSIGAGPRFLYFDFEQLSHPNNNQRITQRLKGDNNFGDIGWQIGTRYRILDNLAWGLVYKSKTYVGVKGTSRMNMAYPTNGGAETELKLPQSIVTGLNWDVLPTLHLGGAFGWTQWSSVNVLDFHLGSVHKDINLRWRDTFRFAVGPVWDFTEDWSLLASYGYETDCSGGQDSTMLPASKRHMITGGLAWRCLENLEIAVSYGIIVMDGEPSDCTDYLGVKHEYTPHRGLTHAGGLTITYRF